MTALRAPARAHASDSRAVHPAVRDSRVLALEEEFPGWHVWQSELGRWWAVRTGAGAQWKDRTGTAMTVDADEEEGMRAELAKHDLGGEDEDGT